MADASSNPHPVSPVATDERYLLAVTLASISDEPSEAHYAAWDRVRAIYREAGLGPLPALLPERLPMLLRAALLGLDGLFVGWDPDTVSDALRIASADSLDAGAALLAGLRQSGVETETDTGTMTAIGAFGAQAGPGAVSEQVRACARFLLPDAARAIRWGGGGALG